MLAVLRSKDGKKTVNVYVSNPAPPTLTKVSNIWSGNDEDLAYSIGALIYFKHAYTMEDTLAEPKAYYDEISVDEHANFKAHIEHEKKFWEIAKAQSQLAKEQRYAQNGIGGPMNYPAHSVWASDPPLSEATKAKHQDDLSEFLKKVQAGAPAPSPPPAPKPSIPEPEPTKKRMMIRESKDQE